MRPTRLELEGFASFADRTVLDLEDADLFVLSGRTGAGKSSLIDAMVFALFGVVPRYDDRRVVEPAITKGSAEARVRLDFRLGDRSYSAVRVVRRVGDRGATTKEARLERWRSEDAGDTVVVADGVDDLNREVERLLGLTFDHFTTCVVLPQGAFSEFLHAKPKARRDLLVKLLDLGVYGQVGQAARTAVKESEARLRVLEQQLDGMLTDATPAHLDAARARVEQLEELRTLVVARQPELDALLEEGRDQAAQERTLRDQVTQLQAVSRPDDVDRLGDAVATARAAAATAEKELAEAGTAVEEAQQQLADASDPAPLKEATSLHEQLPALTARVEQAAAAAQEARTGVADTSAAVDAAATARREAEEHLDHARRQDLVGAVAEGLDAGDPCPVCHTTLATVPDVADDVVPRATATLKEATATLRTAEQAATTAERTWATARASHESLVARLDETRARLTTLQQEQGVPASLDAIREQLTTIDERSTALARARRLEAEARRAAAGARDRIRTAEEAATAAWRTFDATRDTVASLTPPSRVDDDLTASWDALLAWAEQQLPACEQAAQEAASRVTTTRESYRSTMAAIRSACTEADVELPEGATPAEAVAAAVARAASRVENITAAIERAGSLRTQVAEARERQTVASMLGTHLASNRFTEWLVNRALRHLVHAATADLRTMSDGAYSLTLTDGGDFAVIDHRNADEVRAARTLSGGETFLASLALALALSQRVADMAAQGAARLEALFLDEGFGTLDADTLGVVADALEELGARGRMVGVITHVPELAERLPVRFDVTKVGAVSTVTRVDRTPGEVAT